MTAFLCLSYMPNIAEARGKKKKKGGSGGSGGPTCASLGLDCSATCCEGSTCAETKVDCAKPFKRPFKELYYGFATILCITIGVSIFMGIVNFCLQYKFCQQYDEGLDTYVGGFSICDAVACLLTCGLIYKRKNEDENGPSADELDFRTRFEKSMDKQRGEGVADGRKKKKERMAKDMKNYLS